MFKASKFALCGIVACVGMLGGCAMDEEPGAVAETSDPLVQASEAVIDSQAVTMHTEENQAEGDVGILGTVSFTLTCDGWAYLQRDADRAILYAEAASCRRRNGTWTGFRSWSGVCHGDVSNNNGTIGCF